MTNKNGQVPGAQLVSVGICKLWWGSAYAFKAAQAAAANDGVGLAPINAYSGYRSLALQRDGIAHPAKYGVAKGIRQLPEGFQTHGLGTAVDVISGFDWFKEHGHEYGFTRSIPGDTYHFQHDGRTAIGTNPASVGKVTPVTDPKEIEMRLITYDKKSVYRNGEFTDEKVGAGLSAKDAAAELAADIKLWGPVIEYSSADSVHVERALAAARRDAFIASIAAAVAQ